MNPAPSIGGKHLPPAALNQRRQAGLTLLELLLVVIILSTVAFMTLATVDNNSNQMRFEDTRNRLEAVRRAVIGHADPVFNGQRLFSGYAADNGLIPTNAESIETLITKTTRTNLTDAAFDAYRSLEPRFDPVPDVNGYNNDAGTPMDGSDESLLKGWRGSYLQTSAGSSSAYYDGWGNTGAAPDFGWDVSATTTDISITSFGREGASGSPEPPYDDDLTETIGADDWLVETATLQVEVVNNTGLDVDSPGLGRCLRVTMLIYRNQTTANTDGRWRRLTSGCITTDPFTDTSEETVTFDSSNYDDGAGNPTTLANTQVPQGRHLLLLIVADDTLKHSTTTTAEPCTSGGLAICNSASRSTARVDLFAGSSLPTKTLQVAR